MYDSYDFVNDIPGNIIGSVITYYTTTIIKDNSSINNGLNVTFSITLYNFNNGEFIMTATLNNFSLKKVGSIVSDVIFTENIISNSPNYSQLYNLYNTSVERTDIINSVRIECIR